jgi:5-methylcytosine-specific restriction endonuclease McrBC regulatory subunit McrC
MDMNKLFESFITQALIDRTPQGSMVSAQDRTHLDVERKVRLIPDVVAYFGARPTKVLDCKYKIGNQDSFINTDVYQVLAYTRSYNVEEGLIVYPSSEVSFPESIRVRHDGPIIRQLTVNLEGDKIAIEDDLSSISSILHEA